MKSVTQHVLATTTILLIGAVAAFALFVWYGVYNFAADDPHTPVVHSLLETMRERSIETRAQKVAVPDLRDEKRIVQGAGNYNAMCAGCHLAPGVAETELSRGLYPDPPNLSKEAVDPQHAFWVIKHGIKASGMPAWGKSMSDEYVWNMAAFLQVLPKLDEGQYKAMVAHSGGHQHGPGDSHDGDAAHDHDHDAGAHEHDEASDSDKHAESSKSEASGSSLPPEAPGSSPHTHTHADGMQHVHATQGAKQ
ncbi:MAG: c-type cytochrome [Burkholderiaceae bacterium]